MTHSDEPQPGGGPGDARPRPEHTVHLQVATGGRGAHAQITDDRGVPTTEIDLPDEVTTPPDAERHLADGGWHVTAGWTTTANGYSAQVVR